MADPIILLVAPASGGGAALRHRLVAMGLRCERIDASGPPRAWRGADGDVVLVLEEGGFSSPASLLTERREGTRLEGLPLLVLGGPPAAAGDVDEVIPADVPDRVLLERLRVWGRWANRVRRVKDLEAQVRDTQATDPLTGLAGHRAFQERLEVEVKRADRYASPLGLVLADVDGMHALNERFGHKTGDRVLREIAETLRRSVRDVDMVSRYASDTFAILLPESGTEATEKVVARLRGLVASLILKGDPSAAGQSPLLKAALSFGHACLPDERVRGAAAFLAAAEAALARERTSRTSSAAPA